MIEENKFSLVKPSHHTPFHIDFDWWQLHDSNWRVYLQGCLCAEHQKIYSDFDQESFIDWVDPVTAEVRKVDGIQNILIDHCAKEPGFISQNTTLVDSVFRILLANGNQPMTADELGSHIGKSADVILRTLSGHTVFKGIRPIIS